VWKKGSALVPSFTAFAVVQLLEHHFADLVDYAFTARMEDDLDGIAAGLEEAQPWLSRFYFGNGSDGLKAMVDERLDAIDAKAVNSIPIGTDAEGREIVVRVGRYGPYLTRGEETAAIPEDLAPDELTVGSAEELLAKPSSDRVLGTDPESGLPVLARAGRYGPYVQLGEGDAGAKQKPRTSSLLSGMTLDTVTLDDALKLLSLPRTVGVDPADGEEITVQNGRYGPYVKKGSESRSLENDEQLFSLTLDEALAVLAQPRRGRGQKAAAGPLRQLGADPVSGAPVELREGRFGPYVTDGTTNASLRTGDSPESITIERAAELLQARRERGRSAPPRGRAKKATKATKAAKATKKATKKTAKASKASKAKTVSGKGRSAAPTGTEA
jgi:DNA topoisomerase I